ncbi:hypothetical protein FOZ62_023067, partial [Perkinsus olseni]
MFCLTLPPLVYHGTSFSTTVKLAVCVISIAVASGIYVRYELAISRKLTGDSATEKLWNVMALVGLRSELPLDSLFIALCYEIHSGLCMAAAAGMAMSLLVQFLVVNCFLACSDCDRQLSAGLGFVAMDQFIIVEALWVKYSNSVSARVLECPGLRGATVSPSGVLDFKVISRMMFLTSPQLTVQLLFLSQRHTFSSRLIRAVVVVIAMIGIARGFICGRARFGDVVVLRRGGVLVALAVAIGMMRAQGIAECEVIDKKKFYASKRCAETEFRDGPKGLKYREVKIGEGKTATKGSLCTVHYEGKSLSGSRMECTFKNSLTGIRFYCGKRRSPQPTVAAFLNEGVVGMREGGHREMIVPPHMHYPERWPNRILIYEVSLMRVRGGEGNEEADAVEKEEFDNMPWLAKSLFPPPPPTYQWTQPISERLGPQ